MCVLTPAPAPAQGESWRWVLALERCEVLGGLGLAPASRAETPPQLPWHHDWGCSSVGGLAGEAEPSSAVCSTSPVARGAGHPSRDRCHLPVLLALSAPSGPCAASCQREARGVVPVPGAPRLCPEPEHCVHSKACARDPPYAPAMGGGWEYPSASIQNCSSFLGHGPRPHGPRWVPPLLLQQSWMWGPLRGAAVVSPGQDTA